MNEGRKSQIVLLDERRLDILIQPKLFAGDLLDLVASHFKLREKQYFGLAYADEWVHYHWLHPDKRVLDHDFPKKTGVLVLHFAIRYYVDTIGLLRDIQTVELFYLNARQAIFKGHIECDSETVFELAAHVLQANKGDFVSEDEAKENTKKLPIIPTRTLKQHPSISYCEDKVISYYQKLQGTSRGLAIVNYMTIVEKLPTYGIHYYEVKDKKDIPWWLGISPKGIAVYDKNDKTTPRKMFTWKNLENLYYRDKKFSIEVHDPKRIVHTLSSFNLYEDAIREPLEHFDDLSDAITDPTTQVSVSRRTFGASSVNVHAWLASSQHLTKCIWSMAVAQHQFYLERKQSKGTLMSARSMSEIAQDLCRSSSSLGPHDLSRSPSSHSLPSLSGSRFELNTENIEAQKAEREMFQALKARKEALEETLRKKLEELKLLCYQEGELTGHMPKEMPLEPGERVPTFRRRVGTSFAISPKTVGTKDGVEDQLGTLELEYELQSKITSAAHRLAQDKSTSKYVRKQRRHSYSRAAAKLKDTEKKLMEMKKLSGKGGPEDKRKDGTTEPSGDATPARWDSRAGMPTDRSATLPPHPPSHHHRQHHPHHQHHHQHHQQHQQQQAPPVASPTHQAPSLSPSHSSPQLSTSSGYMPSSVYDTRTQYRSQAYPTLSSSSSRNTMSPTSSLSPASTRSLAEDLSTSSLASSSNNLYNVTLQQTSRYESTDMLKSPSSATDLSSAGSAAVPEEKLQLPSKHGSLDRTYKRGDCSYGSLDRKQRRQRERQQGYSVEPRDREGGRGDRRGGTPPLHLDIKSTYMPGGFPEEDYRKVELPVYHEKSRSTSSMSSPPDTARSGVARGYDSYSPRLTETAQQQQARLAWEESSGPRVLQQLPVQHYHYQQQAPPRSPQQAYPVPVPVLHMESHSQGSGSPQPQSPTPPPPATSTLVTVTRLKPHMEVTKPYETSDFFKYSERLRKQRIIDSYQRQLMGAAVSNRSGASTPSQSSDSDSIHSLHSSHSGSSSLSHPMRLAAASAAYYAATGSPAKAGSDPGSSRGPASFPSSVLYHRQDSDQSAYSARGEPGEQYGGGGGGGREQGSYSSGREQGSYSSGSGGGGGGGTRDVLTSTTEFQTVRSHIPTVQLASSQLASSQSAQSSYRAQYMQAVASATHSHYQPPAPMTCRPVTNHNAFKPNQGK
ncbi:FERM domain-containing protein 4A-like [Littorina saxatilis]|uniref:FERM domain-containing protein 4A-like n=1 Tax=Littorina saxatilis TaxID=31220 RepID=UPI0038B4FAC0